jgi:ubiquinone/menaquinone biosynthesis C-methylase UbiE
LRFTINALLLLNICMTKTQKEHAFLRDLYINEEWTRRFTELVDKHVVYKGAKNLLYINAGTGNHAFALHEKIGKKTSIFAVSDDEHLLTISKDKAAAMRSDVDFSMIRFDDEAFDIVLADASFVKPPDVEGFIGEAIRVARTDGKVAFFLPSAGSFGEIFSLLWEMLFSEELGQKGAEIEAMVAEIPTISRLEEIAASAGLVNVETHNATEVFEFENGAEFIGSPLVADFLLPEWLKTLSEKEKGKAFKKLAQLIDVEDGNLTFRFSVKATLVTGEKS